MARKGEKVTLSGHRVFWQGRANRQRCRFAHLVGRAQKGPIYGQDTVMDVLVACEFTDTVSGAFRERGHNVTSCDLEPSENPKANHFQGDVRELLGLRWDLVIAHPPCTFLCNSGVRWLHERPGRWVDMWKAARFFLDCLNANAGMVAVENPVMHGHAQVFVGPPTFTVQPWQFGDPEKKRTCFWTRGLPALIPTDIVQPTKQSIHRMAPSPKRAALRSRFFPGMAGAMAYQWG